MNEWQIARPYAEGYFATAHKKGNTKQWLDFLALISDAVKTPDFHQMIIHPLIGIETKKQVVRALCDRSKMLWCDHVWDGFSMVIAHKRVAVIDEIFTLFNRLYQHDQGSVSGAVYSAHPLQKSEKTQITDWLVKRTNKKVKITYLQDANLIGGFKLFFNDDVWDASLKGFLKKVSLDVKAITTTF